MGISNRKMAKKLPGIFSSILNVDTDFPKVALSPLKDTVMFEQLTVNIGKKNNRHNTIAMTLTIVPIATLFPLTFTDTVSLSITSNFTLLCCGGL